MSQIKNILIVILLLSMCHCGWGQEMKVKSFSKCDDDLSARTEKRFDANGNLCALIKVSVVPNCEFGGYVIGNVDRRLGMYWVYVCAINPHTRSLIISPEGYLPVTIQFADYGIAIIESGITYSMVIEEVAKDIEKNELNGHPFIDLGLSVYWADCNVGAAFPEEYGGLYGWSDLIGILQSKYESDKPSVNIPNRIFATDYDIAREKWGGGWRLPSRIEMEELIGRCLIHSDTVDNTTGVRLTGPSGHSIFIPFAGSKDSKQEQIKNQNVLAYLWSGECDSQEKLPYVLRIGSHHYVGGALGMPHHLVPGWFYKMSTWVSFNSQFSIRPVLKKRSVSIEYYKKTLKDGKVKIMCQVENYFFNYSAPDKIIIKDANTNEILYSISKEDTDEGIFELYVRDGITLRFEAARYQPVELKLSDILKIKMELVPVKFGLG